MDENLNIMDNNDLNDLEENYEMVSVPMDRCMMNGMNPYGLCMPPYMGMNPMGQNYPMMPMMPNCMMGNMMPNYMMGNMMYDMMPNYMMPMMYDREENMEEDMMDDMCTINPNPGSKPPKCTLNDVDRILAYIERSYPNVINELVRYGVPYPVARRTVRRVIYLTIAYCNR